MKRIELFCIAVAVVIAVCCSFTSRGSQHYSVEKVYTNPNSHMNIYRVSIPGGGEYITYSIIRLREGYVH